jgi:hypothetical protein
MKHWPCEPIEPKTVTPAASALNRNSGINFRAVWPLQLRMIARRAVLTNCMRPAENRFDHLDNHSGARKPIRRLNLIDFLSKLRRQSCLMGLAPLKPLTLT